MNLATPNGLQTSLNPEIVFSKIGIKTINFAIEYCVTFDYFCIRSPHKSAYDPNHNKTSHLFC